MNSTRAVAVLLAAGVAVAGCVRPPALAADSNADRSKVTTTGIGIVHLPPDTATLGLRVDARAPKPAAAQQRAAATATALMQKLRDLRIPADAIRTTAYSLDREYDYVKGQAVFRGYLTSQAWKVRVDDLPRLGEILDAIETAGNVAIEGPQFGLRALDAANADALRRAVGDARAKADAVAQGGGTRIVRIMQIDEHATAAEEGPMPMMSMSRAAEAPRTPIAPGELTVRAGVTLTAEIR